LHNDVGSFDSSRLRLLDDHPSFQQIAVADTETGEFGEGRLNHSDGEADRFYRDLKQRGIEQSKVAATVDDFADHVDHAVKIAWIDRVGIGSDFDGVSGTVNGLEDVSKMPSLVAVLVKRGYSEGDLKKILARIFFA